MRIKKSIDFLMVLLLLITLISSAQAQFTIKNSVLGNGFGLISNTNNKIESTIGQQFIGRIENTIYINQAGFWYYAHLISGIEDMESVLPNIFKLYQNYPNPFNPITHIKYVLPKASKIKIEIYNSLGQKVITLVDAHKTAGYYVVDFNGSQFASGLYFYRIETQEFSKVHKMILLK